eukprot:scaffold8701_cov101-Cylindrotheca_fusiformis.AAC.1
MQPHKSNVDLLKGVLFRKQTKNCRCLVFESTVDGLHRPGSYRNVQQEQAGYNMLKIEFIVRRGNPP